MLLISLDILIQEKLFEFAPGLVQMIRRLFGVNRNISVLICAVSARLPVFRRGSYVCSSVCRRI